MNTTSSATPNPVCYPQGGYNAHIPRHSYLSQTPKQGASLEEISRTHGTFTSDDMVPEVNATLLKQAIGPSDMDSADMRGYNSKKGYTHYPPGARVIGTTPTVHMPPPAMMTQPKNSLIPPLMFPTSGYKSNALPERFSYGPTPIPPYANQRSLLPPMPAVAYRSLLPIRVIGDISLTAIRPSKGFLGPVGPLILMLQGKQVRNNFSWVTQDVLKSESEKFSSCLTSPDSSSVFLFRHNKILMSDVLASMRYVAKKLGIYGVNLPIDYIVDSTATFLHKWFATLNKVISTLRYDPSEYVNSFDTRAAQKYRSCRRKWFEIVESHLGRAIRTVSSNTTDGSKKEDILFFSGSEPSISDFMLLHIVLEDATLMGVLDESVDISSFPNVVAMRTKLLEHPFVDEFLNPDESKSRRNVEFEGMGMPFTRTPQRANSFLPSGRPLYCPSYPSLTSQAAYIPYNCPQEPFETNPNLAGYGGYPAQYMPDPYFLPPASMRQNLPRSETSDCTQSRLYALNLDANLQSAAEYGYMHGQRSVNSVRSNSAAPYSNDDGIQPERSHLL